MRFIQSSSALFKALVVAVVVFMAGVATVPQAQAGTLKDGAVVCLSLPYLNAYQRHLDRHEATFTKMMLDRVQCVVEHTSKPVSMLNASNSFVHLETSDGFRVYTQRKNYNFTAQELAAAQQAEDAAKQKAAQEDAARKRREACMAAKCASSTTGCVPAMCKKDTGAF